MEIPRGKGLAKINSTLARYEMDVIPPMFAHVPTVNSHRVIAAFGDRNVLNATQILEDYLLAPLINDGFNDHSARRVAQEHIIGQHGAPYRLVFEQNPLSFGAIATVIGAHDWLNTRSGAIPHDGIRDHIGASVSNLREIVRETGTHRTIYHDLGMDDKFEIVRQVASTSHRTLSLLAGL